MSLDGVEHIILVLSGKGGVGKSSVTTQLALTLTQAGHSVGILDIDLTGPSIPHLLNLESATVTQAPGGWIPVTVHDSSPAATTNPDSAPGTSKALGSLRCMSLAFLLHSRTDAVVWRGPKKTAMVRQFLRDVHWGPTSYLLIDTPPGTSDEHISLIETLLLETRPAQLAGAVVVTTPQAVATADVRKELNFCKKTGVKVLGVLENMAGFVCPWCEGCTNVFGNGGGRVMAREFGVRFLGSVPVDPQFGTLVEEGTRPVYPAGTVVAVGGGTVEVGGEEGKVGANGDAIKREGHSISNTDNHENAIPETNTTATSSAPLDSAPDATSASDSDLLVHKYRSCSLCPIFQSITAELVSIIQAEGGADGVAAAR